ncbi:MAG: hypothetical protein K0S25_1857 [Bacillus sp. (in: firmicutes)]|nr:hypothetical protein [Bacillus sp. (in: firmicutes)]
MKAFITIIYALACIAFIGISHYYWIQKTTASQAPGQVHVNEAVVKASAQQDTIDELLPLTKNWPEQSVKRFKQVVKENKTFKIVIAGSPALGGADGWAELTKARLIDSFGNENLSVTIKEYDLTSEQFIAEKKDRELASLKADMVLFEPFILKNNGVITIDKTLADLDTIIGTVKKASPDIVFLLQPSYPVYQAKIYPTQVSELKKYAEEKGITYLNHWGVWPDPNTDEIKTLLSADQEGPNEQGHQLWSDFVCDFLISK